MKPSEYWKRQCHIGASFLRPTEAHLCKEIGIDKIMWGSDYPHTEGSYPYTRDHLRLTFADFSAEEATQILTENVARLYKFDVDALRPLAKKVCPTKAEVSTPINYAEIAEDAKGCPGMNPLNQVQQV